MHQCAKQHLRENTEGPGVPCPHHLAPAVVGLTTPRALLTKRGELSGTRLAGNPLQLAEDAAGDQQRDYTFVRISAIAWRTAGSIVSPVAIVPS